MTPRHSSCSKRIMKYFTPHGYDFTAICLADSATSLLSIPFVDIQSSTASRGGSSGTANHIIYFYIFRAPDDIHSSTYVLFSKMDRICSTYVLLNKMDRIFCVWNANHVIYLVHLTIYILQQIKCVDYVVFEMFVQLNKLDIQFIPVTSY